MRLEYITSPVTLQTNRPIWPVFLGLTLKHRLFVTYALSNPHLIFEHFFVDSEVGVGVKVVVFGSHFFRLHLHPDSLILLGRFLLRLFR